jgi:hypothetical protein
MNYRSLCDHCSALKLSIKDFIPVDLGEGAESESESSDLEREGEGEGSDSGDDPLAGGQKFREAQLGQISEIIQRDGCPLCRLAIKSYTFMNLSEDNATTSCRAFLAKGEPFLQGVSNRAHRRIYLGFEFDAVPIFDIMYIPTAENAVAGGSKTNQYFARYVPNTVGKCDLAKDWPIRGFELCLGRRSIFSYD